MRIETERLILRPHIPADFEDYFAYIMDRELQNMLGLRGVDDRASAQETFQWLLENGEFIALIGRDSGRVIGHICVQPPIEKVACAPEFKNKRGASLSFAIAKWERRKGLMLEALKGLIGQRFREGAVDYFDCEYEAANAASRGLQEKLGFQHWGKEPFGDVELVVNILRKPEESPDRA